MVRVDRDLKRCYFYRLKIEGDVKKPDDVQPHSPEFPKSGVPKQDIKPYNPHFRQRSSTREYRPSNTRRISWSREADRVKEISPRSDPEPTKIFYPPPLRKYNSFTEDFRNPEDNNSLIEKKRKKNKKAVTSQINPARKQTPEPTFVHVYKAPTNIPAKLKTKAPKNNENLIRQQREQRYRAQQLERIRRAQQSNSTLRKVKSESNLKTIPKEALMKKAEAGKTKHLNPPRWRHVGDRNRRRQEDKHMRSFASDYYF